MLKVGVVGMGKMGQRHVDKWSQMSDCEIVGIVSGDQEKLNHLGSKFNIPVFTELEALLDIAEVDVVDICLPTYLHYPYIKQIAASKTHIICEKPLGINVAESKEIIEICQEQGVQLYVGQTTRFSPAYMSAREQVKKGAIGKPGVLRLYRGTSFPKGKGSWYGDHDKSGGIILDLGIHDFDWLLWTFGDVERVMAKHVSRKSDSGTGIAYALITLRLRSGAIAHIELSWAKEKSESSFELAGDRGMIVNNGSDHAPIKLTSTGDLNVSDNLLFNQFEESPILQQLNHFKDCILGDAEPIITAEEALKAVEVAEAAIQSVTTGQPVIIGKGGEQ